MTKPETEKFSPHFLADAYEKGERYLIDPFFTNLDKSVYVPLIFSPELIGALCSRTSRARDDLRKIFLKEFVIPFLNPVREPKDTEETWQEKVNASKNLKDNIEFLHSHPTEKLFFNPKARSFYLKWLAQYGDDSIAQMSGAHIVFCGITQVAIKHLEDQRIGLAPIEKSTRYVDYSGKRGGKYLYYTDPSLRDIGLAEVYEETMDYLFDTYGSLVPKLIDHFAKKYPQEPPISVRTKAYDTLRGLLPTAALSQVAFFGNGQAFEYMISRCARHPLGEIRWIAAVSKAELDKIIPAFLRRTEKPETQEYQEYLAGKGKKIQEVLPQVNYIADKEPERKVIVKLAEFDPEGQDKVIAGLIFPEFHESWNSVLKKVKTMSQNDKEKILESIFKERRARWYKVPRALENTFVRFEITMDIGAWRDLHRHRMQTQHRQRLSCHHGYIVPPEIIESGNESTFRGAVEKVEKLFSRIEVKDPDLSQYAVCLAHRIRFMQYQNLREFFWEAELRSIPEGHPNYRHIEQEKYRLLKSVYPLLMKHAKVNIQDYVFARRGQGEKISQKEKELQKLTK